MTFQKFSNKVLVAMFTIIFGLTPVRFAVADGPVPLDTEAAMPETSNINSAEPAPELPGSNFVGFAGTVLSVATAEEESADAEDLESNPSQNLLQAPPATMPNPSPASSPSPTEIQRQMLEGQKQGLLTRRQFLYDESQNNIIQIQLRVQEHTTATLNLRAKEQLRDQALANLAAAQQQYNNFLASLSQQWYMLPNPNQAQIYWSVTVGPALQAYMQAEQNVNAARETLNIARAIVDSRYSYQTYLVAEIRGIDTRIAEIDRQLSQLTNP